MPFRTFADAVPRLAVALVVSLQLAGCSSSLLESLLGQGQVHPPVDTGKDGPISAPAPSPGPTATASASVQGFSGQVLDESGNPAANVTVTAYLANVTPLTSADPLTNIAPLTSADPLTNIAPYRVATAASGATTAVTDAQGRFTLTPPGTGDYNLEAVQSQTSKAFKAQVAFLGSGGVSAGTLDLSPTGTLTGRVTAPLAPTVTDFEGVTVYIPGSSYVAMTDASGHYTISNIAVGSFDLAAYKAGLGDAHDSGVVVKSQQSTQAPDLALAVQPPQIAEVNPPDAGQGAQVTLTGSHFGASTGATFQVSFNGAIATTVERKDDQTIVATIPAGATSGDVVVTVDGLVSGPAAFAVTKTVGLLPALTELDLLAGGSGQLVTASATDTAGAPIASPSVGWSLAGGSSSLAALTPIGSTCRVSPVSCCGDDTLTAGSGLASSSIRVHIYRILQVDLSSASLDLNAPPPTGLPDPGFVTQVQLQAQVQSSDGRVRGVSWSSSDPAVATVDATGLVQAVPSASPGSCIITAASIDLPQIRATASVHVGVQSGLSVGVY